VLAYADTLAQAEKAAQTLGRVWWDARADFKFLTETCLPEDAFKLAGLSDIFPVFLSDSGDNTTAGATGDRVEMLRLAVESGIDGVLIAGITDARAVAACYVMGVGATLLLKLGNTLDPKYKDSFNGTFEVIHIGSILGWQGEEAGRCVVLRVGKVDVIVTENRCAITTPEIITSAGIDIHKYRIVVVKLGYLWPKLAGIASRAIFVMSDGASTVRTERLPYYHVPRPIYPLDRDMTYEITGMTILKAL